MQAADAVLEVLVVGGEVGAPDRVVRTVSRPPDDRHHQVAGLQLGHGGADLLDDSQALMPDDEDVGAGRRGPVRASIDLLVGPVEPDAQDAHQHAALAWHGFELRFRQVGEMRASRAAGEHGHRFHVTPSTAPDRGRPPQPVATIAKIIERREADGHDERAAPCNRC